MANTCPNVRSESKLPLPKFLDPELMLVSSYRVASWITDDKGRKMQSRVWDSVSKRLNDIEPGCV